MWTRILPLLLVTLFACTDQEQTIIDPDHSPDSGSIQRIAKLSPEHNHTST